MWRIVKSDRKNKSSSSFLSRSRSSICISKDIITFDKQLLKNFITEENEYQKILGELSVLFSNIPAKRPSDIRNSGISSNVIVCLSSSLAMMHTLSKDIVDLLTKLETTTILRSTESKIEEDNEDSEDTEGSRDSEGSADSSVNEIKKIINDCEKIVDLLNVYEAFCNNENGIQNNDLLKLYSKEQTKKSIFSYVKLTDKNAKQYSELILYPFLAVDRYGEIFKEIANVINELLPTADQIKDLQELLVESKNYVIKTINFVAKLNQINNLPTNKNWIKPERECLKVSPVKKHRQARPADKERIFFLCNDILIYCTHNFAYKGYFPCSNLVLKNFEDNPTQFQLTYVKCESRILLSSSTEEKIRYIITAESKVEKQDWLQKFHIALCSANGRVEQSPRLNRRVRMSTLEESTLNDQYLPYKSSPLSKELRDLSECLNSKTVWNSKVNPPVNVSINLLEQIVRIYNENRGLLERFGPSGFGLISIHASFQDFETASAELQGVDILSLKDDEQYVFWINVYNILSLHSHIKQSNHMKSGIGSFQTNNKYYIGGHIFSLSNIEHSILRANAPSPNSIISSRVYSKFKKTDPRIIFAISKSNILVNFALNIGSVNCPKVIILQKETWKEQLLLQANMYCRAHIRLYLHSNQRKVHLPKIFQLYSKEFGNTALDMLLYIRNQYLHPSQQQELAFLDDPSASITIKYDNPDWEFQFPIGTEQEQQIIGGLHKEYVLLINQKHIYVRDSLFESKYAFIVPYQLLKIWQPQRRKQLREFGKLTENNQNLRNIYEKQVQHLDMITKAFNTYSQYVTNRGEYHGLSFRPSTYKNDTIFQFVAINLQTQFTEISSDKDFTNKLGYYTHVTFGAPAAHYYKFKNGNGLSQFILQHHKITENDNNESTLDQKEIIETESNIQMRLDVCIPQIVSAFVTALAQKLSLETDYSFFLQMLQCGILVQFESLLSTHGSEIGMIGDTEISIKLLQYFKIKFIEKNEEKLNPNIYLAKNDDLFIKDSRIQIPTTFNNYIIEWQVEYFNELPELIRDGTLISIKPVLFTQGINEKQSMAIRLGETRIQEKINQENFTLLSDYFTSWSEYKGTIMDKDENYETIINKLKDILNNLGTIVETSKSEKNVRILSLSADLSRSIGGLRLTSCKSAKDRTSMSITWEQGRFLHQHASLPKSAILKVANDMRSRGVRRENAFRNIGKQKFKFNSFQKNYLPKPYQFRKNE